MTTEVVPVEIAVPRDRAESFELQPVRKRQPRPVGVDETVLSLAGSGVEWTMSLIHHLCC